MAAPSKIEWTEQTWNPVTGCTKVSPGCKHCYAEILARRLRAMGTPGYENGFKLTMQPTRLGEPIKRKKPTIYFVNSMSDLFHKSVPFNYIDSIFDVIRVTPHHRYQILTKRPSIMEIYFSSRTVPENVWLGTSVEDRKHGLPRIDILRRINAKIRFLSVEPLLEDLGAFDLTKMNWVIVGGESGPKGRPMKPEWARSIRGQCEAMNVPFFFKQWGSYGGDGVRRAKANNGRTLDGRTWDELPA